MVADATYSTSGEISTGSLKSTLKVELVPSQVNVVEFCAHVVQES